MKNKCCLAVIPARGGSKGVPGKNIRLLSGKPLIAYSIKAALTSKQISKVVVTTDNDHIADLAKQCGAEIIKRPSELATDTAETVDVVIHALDVLLSDSVVPDVIVLLQPTSPLRTSHDIDEAINTLGRHGCDSVVSVCEANHPPYWHLLIKNEYLIPLFDKNHYSKRRQDLPVTFIPNGAIYVTTPTILRETRNFLTKRTCPYVMPKERSIDIDSEVDFMTAELFLNKKSTKEKKEFL